MFCQRSKLYRYDGPSKQWKERGVGDFKILHDPVTAKYRMLQRREQVSGGGVVVVVVVMEAHAISM